MPDPDLQIRGGVGWGGGGGWSSRPLDKGGGAGLQKKFFRPFGSQFGLKIRGWPSPPDPPPRLDPPLLISVGSVAMTCTVHSSCAKFVKIGGVSSSKFHLITLWYQVMKVMFNTVMLLK